MLLSILIPKWLLFHGGIGAYVYRLPTKIHKKKIKRFCFVTFQKYLTDMN